MNNLNNLKDLIINLQYKKFYNIKIIYIFINKNKIFNI